MRDQMKKGILGLLAAWMVLAVCGCTAALGETDKPMLSNLSLKSVDSTTIRAAWEGNDPPYVVTCYATNGSSHMGWAEKYDWIQEKTTDDTSMSFGVKEFGMNSTWLFPNTPYTISVKSNSGLVVEKSVRTLKPDSYTRYKGKARLYLMDTDYATWDDIDESRANQDAVAYFSNRMIERKMSLEQVRSYGYTFRPWFTITYQSASDEHAFSLRFLLRTPEGKVVNVLHTIPSWYEYEEAPRNYTWYSMLCNTSVTEAQYTHIPEEAFTCTGKYVFEMYFDEYLAATQTLTIY